MKRLFTVAFLFSASCAGNRLFGRSDKQLIDDYAAARRYYLAVYRAECEEKVGPPNCSTWRESLNRFGTEINLATDVAHVGHLPADELTALKHTFDRVKKKQ